MEERRVTTYSQQQLSLQHSHVLASQQSAVAQSHLQFFVSMITPDGIRFCWQVLAVDLRRRLCSVNSFVHGRASLL